MTRRRIHTILEASLHDEPLLVFETGLGEMAEPRHIESRPGFWKLTGAWSRDRPVDGYMIERWLRGLRPQNGARSAQTARARERLRALDIRRTAPDQGDIVWATPHMEYPRCGPVSVPDGGQPRAGAGAKLSSMRSLRESSKPCSTRSSTRCAGGASIRGHRGSSRSARAAPCRSSRCIDRPKTAAGTCRPEIDSRRISSSMRTGPTCRPRLRPSRYVNGRFRTLACGRLQPAPP